MFNVAFNWFYEGRVQGQLPLDLKDVDEEDAKEIPDVDMQLIPALDELVAAKNRYAGMPGEMGVAEYYPTDPKEKVLQLPYRFVITLTNQQAWDGLEASDPESIHSVVGFLQFLDQEDIQFKLEQALTDALLKGIEVHFGMEAKRKEAGKPAEQEPVELDYGDDVDQDSFDAPFNPPRIAENRRRLPEVKKRKMKKLKIKITESKRKKNLNEIRPSTDLWQVNATLVTNTPLSQEEPGLEDFKNSIRVRCGVTIVDNIGSSRTQGGRTITKIRIKFVSDGSPEQMLDQLKKLIVQIEGVRSVLFISGTLNKAEKKWH
jgi:hypothetical protein